MKVITEKPKKVYKLSESECTELLKQAEAAKINIYPHASSGFSVALMTSSGNIYQGASYKSDTWTLTMHSEMTALTHAANHGETDIVAITGPNCHICKQLIYESTLRSGIDTLIILEEGGEIKQIPISQLMPYAWPEESTS